ncbi:MAG: ATP synthase F1 subunit delta [Bacteroidetes bacterium CG2_30_32_10]|nr:MAG: ATP synthase F1 subunit delta [Bacteroidetes bacterium CG2_30_32_10]
MINTRIAQRYAKALFDLAIEQNIIERVYDDIVLIKGVCETNKDFILLLSSPIIKSDKKQAIIKEIFEKHIHHVTLAFLLIITKKRREYYISQISKKFIGFYKDFKGIEIVTVTSANQLDQTTIQKVLQKLKTFITKEIELVQVINPNIIGGFIIQYDDKKYDASILNKIHALSKNFLTNEYIKEY